jgi:Protein of unknown function (DUF3103)
LNRPTTRRSALALVLCAASIAAVQGVSSPSAGATQARPATHATSAVGRIENQTAKSLAASLADPAWRAQVRSAALGSAQVDLRALAARATAPAGRTLAPAVTTADRQIAAAKGLTGKADSLLRVRLGSKTMRKALTAGTIPWVAATTNDDHATTIKAYDSQGRTHTLNTRKAPDHPVYVVGIDVSQATAVGLGVVDKEFAKAGLSSPVTTNTVHPDDGGFWSTKIDAVYLNDDEEPWVEGDAEIFSIVSGFGFDGHVRVDTVDQPYLDNDHHTYYPNQILVNWSNYKYNLADVVMMEDDGDTNYSALAKAIADALLTITDQGAYIPLVDAVLGAIPDSWYTNDPDYVDSWYTLSKDSSGTLYGARGNGWMTVEPYWVSQF